LAKANAAWISYSWRSAKVLSSSASKSAKIPRTYSPVVPSLEIWVRD